MNRRHFISLLARNIVIADLHLPETATIVVGQDWGYLQSVSYFINERGIWKMPDTGGVEFVSAWPVELATDPVKLSLPHGTTRAMGP